MVVQARTQTFPPPTAGWISAGNVLSPPSDGADVLDNFFPTAQGARLRFGCALHATADAGVVQLRTFQSGDLAHLLACTASKVFEMSAPADPAVTPTALLTGQSNGDWSTAQISTAGDIFLAACNGTDTPWYYDGTTLALYGSGAIDITGSGLTKANLSHVNQFAQRLFFVEKGTMNVWYLPVDSIGGTATKFPLGSVFEKGGAVLMTATWSVDAGDGLDDLFCIFSTEGEVAIYQGVDPASWSKVGLYKIGQPVDKHATFKVGGELLVVTDVGVVGVSASINEAETGQAASALTVKIEDAWQEAVTYRTTDRPVSQAYWPEKGMLIVGTEIISDDGPVSFVANLRTGAWCRYTGWDVRCAAALSGNLYFAGADGKIYQGEVGGTDAGTAYKGRYVPVYSTAATPQWKVVTEMNAVFRSTVTVKWSAKAFSDWTSGSIGTPSPLSEDTGTTTWGVGVWDTAIWGGSGELRVTNGWKTVAAQGLAIAPALAVVSNSTTRPIVDILATQLTYELAGVMV